MTIEWDVRKERPRMRLVQRPGVTVSVTAFFSRFFCSVGNKIAKTAEIFDKVEHLKSRGVTHWAKRNEVLDIKIFRLQKEQLISCIL